jgi:hypothetical protein
LTPVSAAIVAVRVFKGRAPDRTNGTNGLEAVELIESRTEPLANAIRAFACCVSGWIPPVGLYDRAEAAVRVVSLLEVIERGC